MFSFKQRFILLILLLQPVVLSSQTNIILRPQFDSLLTVRNVSYPFKFQKRPRVALVLSGGGARGTTQIGVLKALERHNIPIDFIAATSMGAIVGGLYASGYTTAEIESLALTTNWDEVLSLTEETKRTELFVDQKVQADRSFLVVRFQGLEPVIPEAVSSGQRLTNFLSKHALQSLYQPNPTFDDLKISFRAVTTDLISGRRVVLDRGSLAEALRASATVPLVFNPLKRDSMQLIDGGLISNIPVDLAKAGGYDMIIAVNSTSALRNADELKAPWQTADQIMGIMMQQPNAEALKDADIVISPVMGKHLSTDFSGLDSLITKGDEAAELMMAKIISLYNEKARGLESGLKVDKVLVRPNVTLTGGTLPDSLWSAIDGRSSLGSMTIHDVRDQLRMIYDVGDFKDVYAEIRTMEAGGHSDSAHAKIEFHVTPHPNVEHLSFAGCNVVTSEVLHAAAAHLIGFPLNSSKLQAALEEILRNYRRKGYSLARIELLTFNDTSRVLSIQVNEGVIGGIDVQGGERAVDEFVLREFPLRPGEVFQIDKANQGVMNINSTTLFEYVYLEVSHAQHEPRLTIRIKERPSQLVRLGLRGDDERNLQGSIDIRDENFRGLGMDLGLNINGGSRNQKAVLEFKAHRLFNTYLTFNISTFFNVYDSYFYGDALHAGVNNWDRERLGEYRDERFGAGLTFGTQLEKFGNANVDFSLQQVRIKNKENAEAFRHRYRLSIVRIGTTIDSKDNYPFPTSGFGMNISYESAFKGLGSEVGYNALRFRYESFSTWGSRHTFHPRITFGFGDRTMPLGEQFSLGGRESMFGTREDDRRGRQMLLLNFQYRYHLPVRLLFDSYFGVRFDMGSISVVPEDIKFATLRYGIGCEVALDTPIGPAVFAVGKSFYFGRDLPDNPIQHGPFLFYFMIGYQL